MGFMSFFILLIISVVVCAILHFTFKYYVVPGFWSFLSKVVIGWVGAWLGTPVFGRWWDGLSYEGIFIVPAILGSFALVIFAVDFVSSSKGAKAAPKRRRR
jgi:uncharacterized membrane protein YeaQ/YmgE (transglycosylase-associated protein family)